MLLRPSRLEEARRRFERAIELDPRSTDGFYNLGVVLDRLGRRDEAIRQLTRATELQRQHVARKLLEKLAAGEPRNG